MSKYACEQSPSIIADGVEVHVPRSRLPQKHLIGLVMGGPPGGCEQFGCCARQRCSELQAACCLSDVLLSRPAQPNELDGVTLVFVQAAPFCSQTRQGEIVVQSAAQVVPFGGSHCSVPCLRPLPQTTGICWQPAIIWGPDGVVIVTPPF